MIKIEYKKPKSALICKNRKPQMEATTVSWQIPAALGVHGHGPYVGIAGGGALVGHAITQIYAIGSLSPEALNVWATALVGVAWMGYSLYARAREDQRHARDREELSDLRYKFNAARVAQGLPPFDFAARDPAVADREASNVGRPGDSGSDITPPIAAPGEPPSKLGSNPAGGKKGDTEHADS